ncbi:MAG: hypothetical protein AABM33_05735 [Pseudomonadota bacterium]
MNASTLVRLAAGALLAGGAGAALAADISRIEPSAATVALDGGKAVVRFAVSGAAAPNDRCGYVVDYGDGMAGDSRIIDNENGRFTRPHERIFNAPGTYTVRASGRNVKTTAGCNGAASATVTVVAAAAPGRPERRAERRAAAFACPEGWTLNEKTVNRSTGAFSCAPKPTAQLVCAEGLRYFERDGLIGCRQSGRNQQGRNR